MRRTTLAAAGLAVAGTLVLTGCKDGNEEIAPAPAAPSAGSSSQPVAPAPSSSAGYDGSASASPAPGGAGGSGAVAKSGQTFKIGETATVPFSYGSNKGGQIDLTVASIEQGNPADLEPLKLGDKVKGMIPYYIRYTVKNTGTTDLAYSSVGHMKGLLGDGSEAQGVSIIGKFEKCKDDSLPKGFTNGKTQTNCVIALAPSAQTKVSGALYWGDPYNNLATPPQKGLTWK